ncbi:MAG: FAD-binding oxidoreductase [Pseudomonadota bacterium]
MTNESEFDVAVIGAGIAGASVAAHLARDCRVVLLEMEAQPGYHTTGRSAAIFAPIYGPSQIRALTRASHSFFRSPPVGFTDVPLVSQRDILMLARADQSEALVHLHSEVSSSVGLHFLETSQLQERVPILRDGYAESGLLDEDGLDIDVAALHRGYIGMFNTAAGILMNGAEVQDFAYDENGWRIGTSAGPIRAATVVNAAGAWAEHIGKLSDAEPIGLIPKRRTALIIQAPIGLLVDQLPLVIDVEEQFYLKPEVGRLLISPADETPSPPCDAQPEELDVAICIDRIERAFDLSVHQIEAKWAGLRSFVSDKTPVVGFSDQIPEFYWLAGQGGYGIQTAPALSRFAAAEILGNSIPSDLTDQGVQQPELSPERLSSLPGAMASA